LLELPEVRAIIQPYDAHALCYPWRNPDPAMDALCQQVQAAIKREERRRSGRIEIFRRIWELADAGPFPDLPIPARATIPYLTEPWYC